MLLSHFSDYSLEAGTDEVGRGCLAGPVVAAAVILPKNYTNELFDDSKKITASTREKLVDIIKEDAITWAIAEVDNFKIDEINILNASFLAMEKAIQHLDKKPEFVLVDGNRFKSKLGIPFECIVKGDGKYLSIAAASILAKTHRDRLMQEMHEKEPYYAWNKNKGYPTKEHRQGIVEKGISSLHRKSFQLLPSQLDLFN